VRETEARQAHVQGVGEFEGVVQRDALAVPVSILAV
jgi:hypothetical protein